jgi:hypothetical protein
VKRYIGWMASGFLVLSGVFLVISAQFSGFWSDVSLSIFSALLSVTFALLLVNIFIDQRSRKIAAAPLTRLVSSPIVTFHNEFISYGRQRFGTANFNSLLDLYQANKRDPIALSPDQRAGMANLIDDNKDVIVSRVKEIDDRMTDLINVLGWSFDAKIIAAALNCKQNIAELMANITPKDDSENLSRIEMYLDIDGTAGAVLQLLYKVLGKELEFGDRMPT